MGLLDRINTTQNVDAEKGDNQVEAANNDEIIKKRPAAFANKEREFKFKIQRKIMEKFGDEQDMDKVVSQLDSIALEIIKKEQENFLHVNVKKVVQEVINDITGYGPINPLLRDPEITEVMVNGPDMVYVEKKGKLHMTDVKFRDDAQVLSLIHI